MVGKIKVAVLMGGRTPEHEISLASGREVVRNLNKGKYEVLPVVISRTGVAWKLVSPQRLLSFPDPLGLKDTGKDLIVPSRKEIQGAGQLREEKPDVVFIAMHGPYGEDGTIQGMLEIAGLAYTGSGVLASALGMDKITFKKVMLNAKIASPKFVAFHKGERLTKIVKELGLPPYFVKPSARGSSVGASIVKRKKDLKEALDVAFGYGEVVLVEEYIGGVEVTCSVLGNDKPRALPVIEIIPKNEFFDYESKYSESGTQEIVPARISKSLTKKVQNLAVSVYKELGCRGFARVDFILRDAKEPVVLEINTIPGLTPMSLLPKAAKAAGISYPGLLDMIISYAIK